MVRHLAIAGTVVLGSLMLAGCGAGPHSLAASQPLSSPSAIPSASSAGVSSGPSTSPARAPSPSTVVHASSGPVGAGLVGPWQISAINFRSAQDGVVAASNAHHVAIFRTTDGGHEWIRAGTWPAAGASHPANALEQLGAPLTISFYNARDGLAEWYQDAAVGQMWVDIGRTTNGGRTWTLVTKHLALSDGPNALVMTGRRSAWLANGSMEGPGGSLLQTTDGGRHWARRTEHFPGKTVGTQAVSLHLGRSGSAVLMTTLAGLSRQTNVVVDQSTINSGQTSRTVRMPIGGLPRFLVESRGLNDAYWSSDAQWVLAEGNGNGPIRIFSYDAATKRWRPLTTPAQPQQIVLVGAKTGYFTSASGVWKTVNGGKSWVALPPL